MVSWKSLAKGAYVTGAVGTTWLLARGVRSGHTSEIDHRITERLQQIENPRAANLLLVVSWPGFPPQSRVIPWVLPGAMLAVGQPTEALFQLLGWGTGAISGAVKAIMKRPRPDHEQYNVAEANIGGSSFPSGHVIIYTGVYGFFAYLAHLYVPYRWLRRGMVGGLLSTIALVGPSRVYLGHHWASDVAASYLLGTSYLVVLTSLYQKVRRS